MHLKKNMLIVNNIDKVGGNIEIIKLEIIRKNI